VIYPGMSKVVIGHWMVILSYLAHIFNASVMKDSFGKLTQEFTASAMVFDMTLMLLRRLLRI